LVVIVSVVVTPFSVVVVVCVVLPYESVVVVVTELEEVEETSIEQAHKHSTINKEIKTAIILFMPNILSCQYSKQKHEAFFDQ